MLSQALRFCLRFVTSPRKAAQDSRRPELLAPAVWIYAAFTLGYMLFYWLKPWDFPDVNAAFPHDTQNLFFWAKVMAWQPPLEAAWILLLAGWVVFFRSGKLGLRMILGVAWTAAPIVLIVLYAQKQGLPKPAFAAGTALAFGAFYPFLARLPREHWRPLVTFMLGLNALGLIMLAPMIVSVFAGSPGLFQFSQIAGGLWLLAAGTIGLRELTGLRLPRAFLCVLFAMFLQIAFAFALFFLGAVPKEILKALLYS